MPDEKHEQTKDNGRKKPGTGYGRDARKEGHDKGRPENRSSDRQ